MSQKREIIEENSVENFKPPRSRVTEPLTCSVYLITFALLALLPFACSVVYKLTGSSEKVLVCVFSMLVFINGTWYILEYFVLRRYKKLLCIQVAEIGKCVLKKQKCLKQLLECDCGNVVGDVNDLIIPSDDNAILSLERVIEIEHANREIIASNPKMYIGNKCKRCSGFIAEIFNADIELGASVSDYNENVTLYNAAIRLSTMPGLTYIINYTYIDGLSFGD